MDDAPSTVHRCLLLFFDSWYRRQGACAGFSNSPNTNEQCALFCCTWTDITGLTEDPEECVMNSHPWKGRANPICCCHLHSSFIFTLNLFPTMRLHLHLITLPIYEKGAGRDLNASNNLFFDVYCFLLQNVKLYLWPDWLTKSFRNLNRVRRDNTGFWLKSQCSLVVLNFLHLVPKFAWRECVVLWER